MNCRVRHLDGSPSFVEIIGRDVTQQKREQAALEEARAAAEAASRVKSEFLANISHEIRTPMNGILGMTELTLQGTLQRDQRSNLEVVRTSAEALVTIINDILDFSKMEVGRMELDHAPFEIMPLVGSCLDLVALPAARKGLELVCDVDPALPAEWVGDAPRLRQVLVNLVGNASKFTESGEIVVRVDRIEGCDGRIRARFVVKDTGIGIPVEHHQRIFEMFSQGDGSFSRKYGGTGLGLAIASRLVVAMGGRLIVESAPDKGSSFEFTIDVEPGNDHTVALPNTYSGKTVAVLVQNKSLREAVLRVLRHAGIEIVEDQPASVVITREPCADENTAVVYVRPSGSQQPEYPKDAIVLRPPVAAQALLTAIGSATSNGASILALQRGYEFVPTPDPICLSTTDQDCLSGTVLLAEDNKVNQLLAIRTLEKGGYRVVVANNGREAVELMRNVRADVILMDIQMPEMDGFQATAQIREWSSVPVIAMTAHALKGDRERCLTSGMTDYIPKPVRPAALLQMVERYMPVDNPAA